MGIWSSVDPRDHPVMALADDGDAANYRGEGEPDVSVDVATTTHHGLIRLAMWRDGQSVLDVEDVLLTREAATLLRDRLTKALECRT